MWREAKAMLKKHCGGSPLAIKEMAMEWAVKRLNGAEWEDIVESDVELRATLEALDSTFYISLPPDQKPIFLHLGFFKLGTIIRAETFALTLSASGNGSSSYLQEDSYFDRVIEVEERPSYLQEDSDFDGVIEAEESFKNSQPKRIHVTSVFHKLSIKKLRECDEGASYRVIDCNRKRFNCSTEQNEGLICVSFNGGGCFDASPSYWKCFKKLRVLNFEDFGLKLLPEAVGELIELRYLGLRNNYIEELPHSLGNLKKLKVLDITYNFMVKVPDIIWQMDALVHLYMSDIICMEPLKIEAPLKLKTITYISIDNWAYEVSGLQVMACLHRLGIEGLDENSDVSTLFVSLAELVTLSILELRGFRFRSMPMLDELKFLERLEELKLDGLITTLPTSENFPLGLSYLTLVNSCLDDDPMPVLEKLKFLQYLKLQNAYTGQEIVISEDGFPRIQRMCIEELWQLRNIQVELGGLKQVAELAITNCPFLQSLPKITCDPFPGLPNTKLKMIITKKIAAQIKKSDLFSETTDIDIQP